MLLSWISLWGCLGNTGKQTEETAAPIVYPDACDSIEVSGLVQTIVEARPVAGPVDHVEAENGTP